eukprot:s3859_g5.t4
MDADAKSPAVPPPPPPPPPPSSPPPKAAPAVPFNVRRGQAIFKKHCGQCHTFKVEGRGTVRGPNLLGVVGTMAGAKADIGSEDDEEDHGRSRNGEAAICACRTSGSPGRRPYCFHGWSARPMSCF